jgi:hypothetical protein
MSNFRMFHSSQAVRAVVFAWLLLALSAASVSLAVGQEFGLTVPNGLQPQAVNPGGSSIATIDLTASGGFASPVSLTCVVTSGPVTSSPPVCTPSPSSQVPPADGPSLTVTTTGATSTGTYQLTVTGTSGTATPQTAILSLGVTDLTEDYTLLVSPTTATPSPVAAGSKATTTVTVSPIGSYANAGHQVTLACLSVTSPTTVAATLIPVCSFNPPTVQVASGSPLTSVLTILTAGPAPTTRLWNRRIFYAFWLALPGLGLIGLSTTGIRRKSVMGAFLLMVVAGGLLLIPACNSASSTGSSNVTPQGTYTFTLTGADENGAAPSNTTTNQATVSLAVN